MWLSPSRTYICVLALGALALCGCKADLEGTCGTSSDCKAGLRCSHNVGAKYGAGPTVDVCEGKPAPAPAPGGNGGAGKGCHKDIPFGWTYCLPGCRCGAGQGDCDTDADCKPGLRCAHDVGAKYGVPPKVDICQ